MIRSRHQCLPPSHYQSSSYCSNCSSSGLVFGLSVIFNFLFRPPNRDRRGSLFGARLSPPLLSESQTKKVDLIIFSKRPLNQSDVRWLTALVAFGFCLAGPPLVDHVQHPPTPPGRLTLLRGNKREKDAGNRRTHLVPTHSILRKFRNAGRQVDEKVAFGWEKGRFFAELQIGSWSGAHNEDPHTSIHRRGEEMSFVAS